MPRLGTDLEKENYTMTLQQGKYMKKSRRNLYIALEELERHQLEITALIMDQADKNKIKSRSMGLGA